MSETKETGPILDFEQRITDVHLTELQNIGFTVIDDVLSQEFVTELRSELQGLYLSGGLRNNRTYYNPIKTASSSSNNVSFSFSVAKPHILEAEPPFSESDNTQYLSRLHSHSIDHLLPRLNASINYLNLHSVDLKVQYNQGLSACFPVHVDTSDQVSNRQLTALLYLNKDWTSEDGGCFRLFPYPYKTLDVPPISGRLLLFHSPEMVHRVMPSFKSRYCVTLWLRGDRIGEKIDFPWLREIKEIRFLLNPLNRISFTKLIYSEEWALSISQAFGSNLKNQNEDEIKMLLQTHYNEVKRIEERLGKGLVEFIRTTLPLSYCDQFLSHSRFLNLMNFDLER